ncbi:TniQ family protein [Sphaerisporangium sp. NBC_01403]|uniref:TniQ family protein n=1 Tax=Sphaerisporangium sp. NBC_01403 TaxID=2903599 RepID=UPI003244F6C8
MAISILPRSLEPLPDESLPGYLLRLAHRLERTPSRIALLTGLTAPTRGGDGHVPASAMLHLDPGTAAKFARAARLTSVEVADLCIDRYRHRYPPLDFASADLRRRAGDLARKSLWISTASTRYCPQCLADDGTPLQRAHGGGWKQAWRFPLVIACPLHRRILLHVCPQCEQPAHSTVLRALLPRMGDVGLHPAQCRNTVRPAGRWALQPPACGARLDTQLEPDRGIDDVTLVQILDQQQRMLDALLPGGAVPTAHARDLLGDLITLTTLIKMSWPTIGDGLVPARLHTYVNEHVEKARTAVHERRLNQTRNELFQPLRQPPSDPITCAGFLLAADQLIGQAPRGLREAIAPMLDRLSSREPRALYLMQSRAACSPRLRAALTTQRGGFHAVTRTRARPAASGHHRFEARHVPQFLPQHLSDRYLAGVEGISHKLLRRAASFKLIELAGGGTWIDAAETFQIPITTARSTLAHVRRWSTQNLATFADAIDSIAEELDSSVGSGAIDYQARRRILRDWSIPAEDWQRLLTELTVTIKLGRPTELGDRKRRVASVLVWTQITQGEHLFAPLVMAEKYEHGGSGLRSAVNTTLRRSAPRNADLRIALTAYAERLIQHIDELGSPILVASDAITCFTSHSRPAAGRVASRLRSKTCPQARTLTGPHR